MGADLVQGSLPDIRVFKKNKKCVLKRLRVHFFNFVYDNGHFAHYVSLKDPMADMVVLGPFWTFTAQVRVKQARETRF